MQIAITMKIYQLGCMIIVEKLSTMFILDFHKALIIWIVPFCQIILVNWVCLRGELSCFANNLSDRFQRVKLDGNKDSALESLDIYCKV